MQIREQLEQLISAALEACIADGSLALEAAPAPALERPREAANGDWASTVAMRCAKAARTNPRAAAESIIAHLPENTLVDTIEIAGPGFINIRLTAAALQQVAADVRAQGMDFGKGDLSALGTAYKNINLEYVSANPTGPMHVGHGRWAALGDAMARVLRHAGYNVSEEFYINDHGVQMDTFATSLEVRYRQELGEAIELPENCYGGAYVVEAAKVIIAEDGDKWLAADPEEAHAFFRARGYELMISSNKATLEGFGNHFDTWFSESSLYVPGEDGKTAVDRALDAFREQGYIFEKDGATWFRSTAFEDEKDRVLIKENGEMTYFMSDCAYHYNKMQRGFDHLIDLWGADHHGYIKRCEAMLAAWGYPGVLEVCLGQLVNLFRDGEAVRMSKRTGEMVTFDELIDEVGVDATRFLMLSRSSDQPIDFDIEVAKRKDASNPVYYVQYAHARICSILAKGEVPGADVDLSVLTAPEERALMSKMDDFADLITVAARDRAPFKLTHYAQELAATFHQFYTECRVLGVEPELQAARLALCDATRSLLALTLSLLGVSAPQSM